MGRIESAGVSDIDEKLVLQIYVLVIKVSQIELSDSPVGKELSYAKREICVFFFSFKIGKHPIRLLHEGDL